MGQNGAANFIADTAVSIVTDIVNRTNNTATSYPLTTDAANNTLTAENGMVLRLSLLFNNQTNFIQIGRVRVTLDTNY